MLPNFLLIGPGRTGTSWVTKNLMLHPEIFIPRCKETRFFNHKYDNGLQWYESHFKGRRENAIGEASVGYFANPEAAQRIHQHIPDVKMIATLRDPVDRAYSWVGRLRAFAKPGDINATIDFEEKLKVTPQIVEEGRYASLLERYFAIFPKDNILVLFYKQLMDDPRAYLRQIYEFLNVNPEFDSPLLFQQINATATVSAKSRLKKLAYRAFLRLDLFQIAKRIDNSMQRKPEPLGKEVRKRVLHEHYLDEIDRLEQMLNVDLSHWKEVQ